MANARLKSFFSAKAPRLEAFFTSDLYSSSRALRERLVKHLYGNKCSATLAAIEYRKRLCTTEETQRVPLVKPSQPSIMLVKQIEKEREKMIEKNFAIVFRMLPERWKQVEDFLDSVGATVIFVKQADTNRKLVVKNLPAWKEENQNGNCNTDES